MYDERTQICCLKADEKCACMSTQHAAEKTNHLIELVTCICMIGVKSPYLLPKERLQKVTLGRIVENKIINFMGRKGRGKQSKNEQKLQKCCVEIGLAGEQLITIWSEN